MEKSPVTGSMFLDYEPQDLDVQVAELLVATSESSDADLPPAVGEVLGLLRERLGMDVAFVSSFSGGRRTFEVVESRPDFTMIRPGMSDPLEESWCQRVVEGRLPEVMPDAGPYVASGQAPEPGFEIGAHLSTPVRLRDGSVYGTLCCFSARPSRGSGQTDIDRLRYTAKLLAMKLDEKAQLRLEPADDKGFRGTLG